MNFRYQFNKELIFLKSALTEQNYLNSTEEVLEWLRQRNNEIQVSVKRVPLKQIDKWHFDKNSLCHVSGKFFSIDGIRVETNIGSVHHWEQPIINQPEIGFLGIITKEFNSVLYFLMQAKVEPGNVNNVQLSPTLQATKSNYTQVHKGKKPTYLEYFMDRNNEVLLDQLQSEQGGRFLKKRNRNIIIKINSDIQLTSDFRWLTLGQLKKLMLKDNVVNMDTRTVISGITYGNFRAEVVDFYKVMYHDKGLDLDSFEVSIIDSLLNNENAKYSISQIISWITNLKAFAEFSVKQIPLNTVTDWSIGEYAIAHKDKKYFKVIGVEVSISNREVVSWMQPLVEPSQDGLCVFIVKKINGVYHFIVQAKMECGNFDTLEMAPTVQCLTGNYQNEYSITNLPFLDYVLNVDKGKVIYEVLQSEEGGRFYHEQNKNMIIDAGNDLDIELPDNYIWMTLNQLKHFIQFNNYLNIQARNLIAAINYIPVN
jgi:oxidase EvaA